MQSNRCLRLLSASVCYAVSLVSLVSCSGHSTVAPSGSWLSTDPAICTLGDLVTGTYRDFEFRVHNSGDQDITLIKKGVSCHCVKSDFTKGIIRPKESIPIKCRFLAGASGEGKQIMMLGVEGMPELLLPVDIVYRIRPPFSLVPDVLRLQSANGPDSGNTQTVMIHRNMPKVPDGELEVIAVPVDYLKLSITPRVPHELWEAKSLASIDDLPVGQHFAEIALGFSGKTALKLPVEVSVRGPFSIEPSKLNLGILREDRETLRSLRCVDVDGSWEVLSIVRQPAGLDISLTSDRDSLRLSAKKGKAAIATPFSEPLLLQLREKESGAVREAAVQLVGTTE